MARTILRLSFLLLAGWILYVAWAQEQLGLNSSLKAASPASHALVLYQTTPDGAGSELYAQLTANLIGHFGKADLKDVAEIEERALDRYDAIFVLPAWRGGPLPADLLAGLRRTARPTVWIHHGIEQLFADPAFAAAQSWRPAAQRIADYREIQYKGIRFPRDPRANEIAVEPAVVDGKKVRVYASAIGADARLVPWALREGNFFYLVEAPFSYRHEDDRYLVFADLLFEVLAPNTPGRRRALVRIEDVGPEGRPGRIRRMADLLAAEGVPFSISVYDTYRDPAGRYNRGKPLTFSLRHRPRLVRALEYAVAKGGTLVAHGHTHQTDLRPNPYSRVSGGDYEFFAADLAEGAFDLTGPLPSVPRRLEESGAAPPAGLHDPSLRGFACSLSGSPGAICRALRARSLFRGRTQGPARRRRAVGNPVLSL
jgi:uncharacterized protein YdaL